MGGDWGELGGSGPLEAQGQPRRYTLPTKNPASRWKVLWVMVRTLRIQRREQSFLDGEILVREVEFD